MKKILLVRSDIETARKYIHPVNFRPPYTLKYIQALLEKEGNGFVVRFIDAYAQSMSFYELLDITFAFSPDILVISSTSLDIKATKNYTSIIKQKRGDVTIIIIGPGPSTLPVLYKQNDMADFILRGESELEVYSIVKRIGQKETVEDLSKIYKLLNKKRLFLVKDIDSLPFVNYTTEEVLRYTMYYPININKCLRWGHILSSRGCPYDCIFCSPLMRDSYGKKPRFRSAKNVVDEIEFQLSLGFNIICFDDDNFTTSKDHVLSICSEILKRKLKFPWIVHARIDNLDRDIMWLMKQSGCHLVRLGIESGSQRIIKIIKKTENLDWTKKAEDICNIARDLKLDYATLFILGSPEETQEDMLESIKLAKKLKPDIIQISFFMPFPGSYIYEKNKYNFNLQDLERMYQYGGIDVVNLSKVKNEDLIEMHKIFYRLFLLNPNFILKHIFKYFLFYLFNLKVFFKLFNIRKYFNIKARRIPEFLRLNTPD